MSMSPPKIQLVANLPRDPDVYERHHAKQLSETLREAATFHHDEHIPQHFTDSAAAKYGYVKRGKKYQEIKDKLKLPALVSPNPKTTGSLFREVTENFKVTATQYKASLKMRLPFSGGTGRLRLKPGQTKLTTPQQQIIARITELSVIARDEKRSIAQFIEARYTERVNAPGVRRRITNK